MSSTKTTGQGAKAIRISPAVWEYIVQHGRAFESPNDVLCRVLGITAVPCPACKETDLDQLVWIDDAQVRCLKCGRVFEPQRRPDPA